MIREVAELIFVSTVFSAIDVFFSKNITTFDVIWVILRNFLGKTTSEIEVATRYRLPVHTVFFTVQCSYRLYDPNGFTLLKQ